jgi:hypothetical protein
MTKHIVKIDHTNRAFRMVIPKNIINLLRWNDVKYALVEPTENNQIIVRRFVDGKALETEDN